MQHTSGIILPVLKLLQKKELDIFAVIELIDSVLDILRQTEAIAKTFFIKYLTKLRMNVKNMMLHYWFSEDIKVKFSEIIILLMTLIIFSGKPYSGTPERWCITRALPPLPFKRGATGAQVPLHTSIISNSMINQDQFEANSLQLLAHT